MALHLEGIAGSAAGRRLAPQADRPLRLRVRHADGSDGEVVVAVEGGNRLRLDNRARVATTVNGEARQQALMVVGDELALGKEVFRVIAASGEGVETQSVARGEGEDGDSDRQRRQRRLSASRLAAVQPAAKSPGIIDRVRTVLGANRAERQRLDALEEERRGLLAEAGRHALAPGAGIGLADGVLAALAAGRAVEITPQDIDLAQIERWRELRRRRELLDAEIAALRATLGAAQGERAAAALPSADRERQERAFAALDGVGTEDLSRHAP